MLSGSRLKRTVLVTWGYPVYNPQTMKGRLNGMEITKEARNALATRISKMNYMFTEEYLKEIEIREEEEKKAKNLKDDEFMVMTGDWNAKVDLDCMKSCVEIIKYLTDDEETVEPWQFAGITAMLDQANKEHSVDYSMPQAISDVLGIRFLKN